MNPKVTLCPSCFLANLERVLRELEAMERCLQGGNG